jgi:hypothetical protein
LHTSLPYGTALLAYNLGAGGVAGVATFTGSGTAVLTITLPTMAAPRHSPTFQAGRGEEMLDLAFVAYAQIATPTKECVITLHP